MKSFILASLILSIATPSFAGLYEQNINEAYFVEFLDDGSQLEQIAWSPVVEGNHIRYTICDEETDVCFTVRNRKDEVVLYKIDAKNFVK